jgi:outer membrane protein assembly factor BamB
MCCLRLRFVFALLCGVLAACRGCPGDLEAANWPGWRGPTGQGRSTEKDLPLTWSDKENVRWKVALPDTGNGSPIVWGKRVFITQATDKGKKRGLMCFDREKGKLLWSKFVTFDGKEPTHDTNPYGSATPVTDGELVITSLGSAGLVCYDFAGKQRWHRPLGEMIHIWGNASSPILYGDLVILWFGPGKKQTLIALNKKTGKPVWEHEEPGGKSGLGEDKEWVGSWSTPVIARIGDHDELILSVPYKVKGFNAKTGKELWSCEGLGPLVYTTPVVSSEGVVVALSGFYGPGLAVKAGGSGDVTKTHRLWTLPRPNPQRIGSAAIIGEHAYLISEQGQGHCFELKTGKDLWQGKRVTSVTWSSLVHAAGHLYVTTTNGETIVLAAGPKREVLARNRLGERVMASIAVADGELFIRGYKHLYCIGEKK